MVKNRNHVTGLRGDARYLTHAEECRIRALAALEIPPNVLVAAFVATPEAIARVIGSKSS